MSAGGKAARPEILEGEERLGSYLAQVEQRLAGWESTSAPKRIWQRDASFWPQADPSNVADRTGWLDLPVSSESLVLEVQRFAHGVRDSGFRRILLLGMGGSSLAPETFARVLGHDRGWPDLGVLDSTHPAAVGAAATEIPIGETLFLVSSKSGTTLEPNAFFHYFWTEASRLTTAPGSQFVAITDPGTPLEQLANSRGFRACFRSPPDVGGRYSALTPFGLVPAALMGLDLPRLLSSAQAMRDRCGPNVPVRSNPGLRLAAILGELARAGRDKVVFVPSPSLEALPAWLEQLIAESLGKRGTGIVPVANETDPWNPMGSRDRLLVRLRRRGETGPIPDPSGRTGEELSPVLTLEIPELIDIAGEFFRWEFAIAATGAILGIDPFDQPDVELAKELARQAMQTSPGSGSTPPPPDNVPVSDPRRLQSQLGVWLDSARAGDYIAVQAFLDPREPVRSVLHELARSLRNRLHLATTTGFGPRFLHSTGQLHKGGPPSGLFLQLIDEPAVDLEVPGMSLSFARIIRAQADGDAAALSQRGRRLLRVQLGRDAAQGLRAVSEAIGA